MAVPDPDHWAFLRRLRRVGVGAALPPQVDPHLQAGGTAQPGRAEREWRGNDWKQGIYVPLEPGTPALYSVQLLPARVPLQFPQGLDAGGCLSMGGIIQQYSSKIFGPLPDRNYWC